MAPTEAHAPLLLARAARGLVSYAPEDEPLCEKLAQHLALLQRRGLVELWDQRALLAGESAEAAAAAALDRADLVLLLVSAAFHASDLWERDLEPALARERAGATRVIPILARPADFDHPVLAERTVLPRSRVPITSHEDPEVAWAEVADEIGAMLEHGRPSDPGGPDAAALELLDRVERVCRLNEPGAEIARKKAPLPFGAYLEVTKKERGRVKIFPVGVLLNIPSNQTLDIFVTAIDARYRAGQARLESVLVHQGPRAPQSFVDAAYDRGVVVQTFEEHTGGLDFSQYVARQLAEVRSNRVYPPELYIPQRARVLVGRVESEVASVLDELAALLRSPDPQFLVVLADFGTGKTFLLRKLFLSLAGTKIVPIRIEMRALDKAQSLDGMLAAHFMQSGERAYDRERFRYMLEEGDIALMFDGFDELALRVSYDRAGDHLETLIEAAQGRAKVVLTSRSQHFLSDAQAKEAIAKAKTKLANRVDYLPGVRFVKLQPFNEPEILAFLNNKLKDPEEARERFELLRDVKDLLGLSHNPRMLSFIAEVPEDKLREAKARRGDVTAATLYELILRQWLGYEIGRANPRGAPVGLDAKDTWRALIHFAEHLWGGTEKALDVTKLAPDLERALTSLGPSDMPGDQKVFAVASGSLLVRDEEGRFSFVHRSVLEFLVAWTAACQLRAGRRDIPLLSARAMSELMADFFADEAGRPLAEEWAQGMLAGEAPEIAKKNADLVLRRMGASPRSRASFKNADLRGQDFTGRSLKWADFSGADLSHAKLVGADLEGALFTGARLADADLSMAKLVGANLANADLSHASMIGCDARGVNWTGTVLYRTKLAGASVDDGAISQALWRQSAAVPPIVSPRARFAGAISRCASLANWRDLLASGHEDGTVCLWDLRTSAPLRTLNGHGGPVRCVAFAPDGSWLASGSDDGTIRIWDPASGVFVACKGLHNGPVKCLAAHPGSALLASGGQDKSVRLWDPRSGKLLRGWQGLGGEVNAVTFSPDGSAIAYASGVEIKLRDLAEGSDVHSVRVLRLEDEGTSLAYGPDGVTMVTGTTSGRVSVWDLRYRTPVHTHQWSGSPVTAIVWAHDGSAVFYGNTNGSIGSRDMVSGEHRDLTQTQPIVGLALDSERHALASASTDGTIRIWNTRRGGLLGVVATAGHQRSVVAFSPVADRMAISARDLPVWVWNARSLRPRRRMWADPGKITSIAFSRDGQSLACGYLDSSVRLFDTESGNLLGAFVGHSEPVRAVAVSLDGGTIASGSDDRSVRLWNVSDGSLLRSFKKLPAGVTSVAFSPHHYFLAWGAEDEVVRLWQGFPTDRIWLCPGHTSRVAAVAFSPTENVLASGSDDGSVFLFDVMTPSAGRMLAQHTSGVSCLAFHPSGRMLACGYHDAGVRLRDISSGRLLANLEGHGGGVTSVAFDSSGRLLAAGCGDGLVHIWRVTGKRLARLSQTKEGWVAYTPDGRYKMGGNIGSAFWHVVGLCRFEAGELDPYVPGLRKAEDEPLFTLDP